MVVKTIEITRHRLDADCKAFKPAAENLIQTVWKVRGRKKKNNEKHSK